MKKRYLILSLVILLGGMAAAEIKPRPKNKTVAKVNKNKKKKFNRMFGY